MQRQNTSSILMIEPARFRYNEQTATNNHYQKILQDLKPKEAQQKALSEFNDFAEKLRAAGIEVIICKDQKEPDTPDAIFPNNWVSFHEDGTVVLYPMFAPNRRLERRMGIIRELQDKHNFEVSEILDLSHHEKEGKFLEGTGSLVLDRQNRIAYACLSERTNREVLEEFCEEMDFEAIVFSAWQNFQGKAYPIYHTNVMMSVGSEIAVV